MSLEAYEINQFIAPGGSSAVFAARRKNEAIDTDWKVAVKFVWDAELAKQEARNLAKLAEVSGVVTLIDYFEVPFGEVAAYLPDLSEQAGFTYSATVVQDIGELTEASLVGVLVLQFLQGAPLIKRTVPVEEPGDWENDADRLLVRDRETGQWLVQELFEPLDFKQRINLLTQIAQHIDQCHQQGIVHGDLKPQNILYNPSSGSVTIFDFGGNTSKTRGSPGWQAPEHLKVAVGDLDNLPREADVFLLGLFIHRYLSPLAVKGVRALTQTCLGPADQRPSGSDVVDALRNLGDSPRFAPLSRMWVVASVLSLALVLLTIWYIDTPPDIEIKKGPVDGSPLPVMDNGEISQKPTPESNPIQEADSERVNPFYQVSPDLKDYGEFKQYIQKSWYHLAGVDAAVAVIKDPNAATVRKKHAARFLAMHYAEQFPRSTKHHFSASDIDAVLRQSGAWWFRRDGVWYGLGDFVRPELYLIDAEKVLHKTGLIRLHLESLDQLKRETLDLGGFAYQYSFPGEGTIFLKDAFPNLQAARGILQTFDR